MTALRLRHPVRCKIPPAPVPLLDQRHLLLPPPPLQLLLPRDRVPRTRRRLEIDQLVRPVPGREARWLGAVLHDPPEQVPGDPDVDAAAVAGEDVDPVGGGHGARWEGRVKQSSNVPSVFRPRRQTTPTPNP